MPSFPTALYLVGSRAVSFARLFMSQPWIAAAVMRMMTWGVKVPLKVYRRMGDDPADRQRLMPGEHPLVDAFAGFDRTDAALLTQQLLGPFMVHGNSVTLFESGANETILMTPKDWRFTRPIMPFRDTIDGFQFDVDSDVYMRDYSVDDVLHIRYWSPTGPIGCSPLQQLGVTIQIEDAAQRYQRALFANGARPPSAITQDPSVVNAMKPAERLQAQKQLRADLTMLYTGPDNAGKPALLPPGLDWKPVGQSTVEAELMDQRRIAREEIAAVYQIPPPMLGILDKATYANITTQKDMVYTDCIGPPLVMIEGAINQQIVQNLLGETDIFVEFDFSGALRGDPLEEIQLLQSAIQTALLTPNEGRSVLNRAKSENPAMDEFYLPVNNIQPVGTVPNPQVMPGVPVPGVPGPPVPGPAQKRLHVEERFGRREVVLQ